MKIIYRGGHSNNVVSILGKRGKIEEMIPFTTEEDLQRILPQKRKVKLNEVLARLPSNKKVNFPIPVIMQPDTTQIEQPLFQTFASPQTPTQSTKAEVPQAITIAGDNSNDQQFDFDEQFGYDNGSIFGSGTDYSGTFEFY